MSKLNFWQKLLTAIAIIGLVWFNWTGNANAYYSEEEKIFLQAWRTVNQAYVDETFNDQNWWFVRQRFLDDDDGFSDREATYQAIEEMLATLDDPFTRLLRPQQYRSLQVNTSGELSGVGLQININAKSKQLEVVTPIDGSPAEKAGIEPRDQILAIDGVSTKNLSLDEAASRMRGKEGTQVKLTVKSPEGEQQREVEIVRDRISLSPVYARLDDNNPESPIGYVRLAQFSANATKEIAHQVSDLEQQGAQGFILDLRNNPGGLLQAGIEVARLWLDNGTVVYTVDRQGMIGSYGAKDGAITDAPLIVLVNQGSASASEILAGALQDNHRATIVGETTFGKGLIQSLFELPDDAGIAVTVAKYETPSHRDINEAGIEPDYQVSQSLIPFSQMGTEEDQQYQEAVKLLREETMVAQN